jgi:tetratricopeptide (TPR) repeat protein/TolB-like protein
MTRGAAPLGSTAARFALGASLGTRYEIQALLGQGGMGAVYKAYDRELDRTVAIKVIRPEMAQNLDVLERFKREIILASKVTHRNVLRIHDFGEAGDVKFISMNYVEGESLTNLLQREGPLSVERALPIVRQIGEALQAAHDAGVVHRDLKPQNILLDREGSAFIADFGISRSMESGGTITEAGSVIGTVDYMSPEQARGEKSDPRGDLYSFGVILYLMLTGKLPFAGGDALSVMMKRLHEEPQAVRKVRPELPAWISDVVARALQRDPADRYQSVAEMLRDLETRHAATSWRRWRRRVLVPAIALVVIAAAAYGGIRLWKSRPAGGAAAGPMTSLAVLPFQNATGDPRYDWAKDGLLSQLRDNLLQTKTVRLAGEDRIRETIETLRAPAGEESRPPNMRRIATIIGADNVLAGKLLKISTGLRIEATLQRAGLQDTSTPPISVDGAGDADIQKMLAALTPKILEALGVTQGWLERARGAPKPTAHSPEALALHGQGLAFFHAGKYLDASKKLEETVQKDPGFSIARALLAETYENLGDSVKAKAEAKKAAEGLPTASPYEAARIQASVALIDGDLEAAEKAYASLCDITPSDAEAFFQLAQVREEQPNFPGALEAYRRVVALDPKYAKAHASMGKVLYSLGSLDEAVRELNTAVTLFEETGNDEGKGSVLNGLGILYMDRGQYGEALTRFQQSLNIKRKFEDQLGVRKALINIALTLARQGRFDEAISTGQEAIAVARTIGDRAGLANTLSVIGDNYQMAAQPENAMLAYQESLKIFREKGFHEAAGEARALDNLAYANTLLGRSVEALYSLKDALAKRRAMRDPAQIIGSLSDIGDNERLQGGYDEALKYYTEGLSLARTAASPFAMGFLGGMSNVHEEQGDYGAALSLIEEGVKLARDSKDPAFLSTLLPGAAGVRRRLGDLSAAAAALDEALPLAQTTKNPRVLAEIAIIRAGLDLEKGQREPATASAREALRITKGIGEPWFMLRARMVADEASRSIKDLELVAKEAEGFGLIPLVGVAHLTLARVRLESGQGKEAVRDADAAVETATSLGQKDVLFQAEALAGQALLQQGDRARAADRFAAALAPLEDLRSGLRDEPLKSFLGRAATVAFGKSAADAFAATNRSQDAERLQRLLRP